MKAGYLINVMINHSNQLNKFWMLCLNINKTDARILRDSKMTYFHLECQNPIKKSNYVLFLHPHFLYFSPNFWNVDLWFKKIIWLSLLTHSFYEKIQDFNINSKNFYDLDWKKHW
jgi:hypothetical protein